MGKLIPRDIRSNPTSTAVWLASKRRDFIRNGGIAGLGPELQPNFDMSQGVDEWIADDVTIQSVVDVTDDAVLMTALNGSFNRGEMSISGLEVGKNYLLRVSARRGQGTDQLIRSATWCTFQETNIDSTSYKSYEFTVVATSVSGVTRVFASNTTGMAGDEVYVRELSIREVL